MHFVSDRQRRAVFSRLSSRGNNCDVKSHVFSRLSGLGNLVEHSFDGYGQGNYFFNGVKFSLSCKKEDPKKSDPTSKDNFASIYMMLNDISHDSSRPKELRKKCSEEVSRMTGLLEKSFSPEGEFMLDLKLDRDDDVKVVKDDDDDDIIDLGLRRRYRYMTESDDDKRGVFSECVS